MKADPCSNGDENPFCPKEKKPNVAFMVGLTAALALVVYLFLSSEMGELCRRTVAIFVIAAVL